MGQVTWQPEEQLSNFEILLQLFRNRNFLLWAGKAGGRSPNSRVSLIFDDSRKIYCPRSSSDSLDDDVEEDESESAEVLLMAAHPQIVK